MTARESQPLVVGVAGSLRDDSVTRQALERALESARARGARTELVDLREYELPMLDPDAETPADAQQLNERLEAADTLLLGTPTYHGGVASPLKTVLDYAGRDEIGDTTVGLVSVAGGEFPTRPLDQLRAIGRSLGAWVLPHQVAVPESHGVGATFADDVDDRLDELGEQAVAYATIEPTEQCRAVATADD